MEIDCRGTEQPNCLVRSVPAGGHLSQEFERSKSPHWSDRADIEQTIVVGVHGPKEAHLVLLDSAETEK